MKFKNYSSLHVKWMEQGELADSPQVLALYLEAFQLEPTLVDACSGVGPKYVLVLKRGVVPPLPYQGYTQMSRKLLGVFVYLPEILKIDSISTVRFL